MYSTNQHVYSSTRSGNNCNVRGQLEKSYRHAHTLTYSQQTRSSPFSSSKTNDATVAVRVYREQNPTTLVWQHLNARWFTHSHLKPIVYQNHACSSQVCRKNLTTDATEKTRYWKLLFHTRHGHQQLQRWQKQKTKNCIRAAFVPHRYQLATSFHSFDSERFSCTNAIWSELIKSHQLIT